MQRGDRQHVRRDGQTRHGSACASHGGAARQRTQQVGIVEKYNKEIRHAVEHLAQTNGEIKQAYMR